MTDSLQLEASQQRILEGLDQVRKTLPPWFPDKVWIDVKRQVAAIDLVHLLLPLYQQYFTEQDGAGMDLMFQGPTGQAYAHALLESRLVALHSGLEGSAADRAAMQADAANGHVDELKRKRAAELTPEQLAAVHNLGRNGGTTVEGGLKLDDQQNVLVQKKVNEVLHAALAAHNTELVAAQQAYTKKR